MLVFKLIKPNSSIGLLLAIYYKVRNTPYSLYLNYMEDVYYFMHWLGPFEGSKREGPYPWYLGNYETQRLSIISGYAERDIIDFFLAYEENFLLDGSPNF